MANEKLNKTEEFASEMARDYMGELPSYLAKATMYFIFALIFASTVWAYLGVTDVVVSAKGVLVPKGEAKAVQSTKDGVVVELFVKPGDKVTKDSVLVRLDSSINADIKVKIEKAKSDIAQKMSELEAKKRLLQATIEQKERSVALFDRDLAIKKEMLATSQNSQNRIKEQYEIFKKMHQNELISKVDLLKQEDAFEKAVTSTKQLASQIESVKIEKEKALEDISSKILASRVDISQVESLLGDTRRMLEVLELQYQKEHGEMSKSGFNYDVITAPVDGVVSFSEVKYVGDYVRNGQVVLSIIPEKQPLVAKIEIPNSGVGKVKTGMRTKIKYDGYPYQEFGTGNGKLVYISPDSKQKDKNKPEFFYDATVELAEATLEKKGEMYPLFAGLSLSAEIVTDEKRLIDFVLEFFGGK